MTPTTDAAGERVERYATAKEALRRWHRDTCYPEASKGELQIGLDAVLTALAEASGAETSAPLDVMAERLAEVLYETENPRRRPSNSWSGLLELIAGKDAGRAAAAKDFVDPHRERAAAILARLATPPAAPDAEAEGLVAAYGTVNRAYADARYQRARNGTLDAEHAAERDLKAAEGALLSFVATLRADNARLTALLATRPPVDLELQALSEAAPNDKQWRAKCGVCGSRWCAATVENPAPHGSFCPDCRSRKMMAPGVLNWSLAESTTTDGAER